MTRNILDEAHIHPAIRKTIANNHADAVSEVRAAVVSNDVVVVGMKQNPFSKKARKSLDAAGIAYKYLTSVDTRAYRATLWGFIRTPSRKVVPSCSDGIWITMFSVCRWRASSLGATVRRSSEGFSVWAAKAPTPRN